MNKVAPQFNKQRTCCFSGHRVLPEKHLVKIFEYLLAAISGFVDLGYDTFISGGALGFDMLAADAVLFLKNTTNPEIKLVIAVPCLDQDRNWPDQQKKRYRSLLERANQVVYVSDQAYDNRCMMNRNRFMVDNSQAIIYYLDYRKQSGGTYWTVQYAEEKDLDTVEDIYADLVLYLSMQNESLKRVMTAHKERLLPSEVGKLITKHQGLTIDDLILTFQYFDWDDLEIVQPEK